MPVIARGGVPEGSYIDITQKGIAKSARGGEMRSGGCSIHVVGPHDAVILWQHKAGIAKSAGGGGCAAACLLFPPVRRAWSAPPQVHLQLCIKDLRERYAKIGFTQAPHPPPPHPPPPRAGQAGVQ